MAIKNYDKSVEINHNSNWPYMLDHPFIKFIIVGSRFGKNNLLLNFIKNQQPNIDKTYLYIRYGFE